MDAQTFFRCPCCVLLQIVATEEFAGALKMLVRQIIALIPHHIDLTRQSIECLSVFVFDADVQSFHTSIILGLWTKTMIFDTEDTVFSICMFIWSL
jgi:hypothetical protein